MEIRQTTPKEFALGAELKAVALFEKAEARQKVYDLEGAAALREAASYLMLAAYHLERCTTMPATA